MTVNVDYSISKEYISFGFEGNESIVIKSARELTKSSLLGCYSHGGVAISLSNPQNATFSIQIPSSNSQSISNLLWYLRTQLTIEIEPLEIKQAAQHFKNSYHQNKLWADILLEAATTAKQDNPQNERKLQTYRATFKEHEKKIVENNPSENANTQPSLPHHQPTQFSYAKASCKVGFFVLASIAAATTLAINFHENTENNLTI